MAGGMLTRKALVLAKLEAAEGTYETLGASDALLVSNPTCAINGEQLSRDIVKDTLSPMGWIVGAVSVTMTFTTEMRAAGFVPDGVAPATTLRDDPLFRMCGLYPDYATGVTYGFDSSPDANETTCSMAMFLDGIVVRIRACRGNVELAMPAGGYGKYNWTAQGVLRQTLTATPAANDGIADATGGNAAPTPTYQATTVAPARFQGTGSFTTQAFAACIESLTLNLNNEIQERRCANADNGVEGYILANRNPGGTMNPELTTRADHDWFYKWQNADKGVLTAAIDNGGTGGEITVNAPKVQYGVPAFGDRNGIRIIDVPFTCTLDSTGDDELTIAYKTHV